MSEEFPGFDKSAPAGFPGTGEGEPTSSWDWDSSSLEQLLEQHSQSHFQKLTEAFTQQMTRLLEDNRRQREREYCEWKEVLVDIRETAEANCHNTSQQVAELRRDSTQALAQIEHYCERMTNSLEKLEDLLRQSSPTPVRFQDLAFWVAIGVSLLFFVLYFIVPKYM